VNNFCFTIADVISSIRYDAMRGESVRMDSTATMLPLFRLRDNSSTVPLMALSRVTVWAWMVVANKRKMRNEKREMEEALIVIRSLLIC
jgi:hypothetical protein